MGKHFSPGLSNIPPVSGRVEYMDEHRMRGWIYARPKCAGRVQLELRVDGNAAAQIRLQAAGRDGDFLERFEFTVALPDNLKINSAISVVEKESDNILPLAPDIEANYESILKSAVLHNLEALSQERMESIIAGDGLFDAKWYLKTFGDIAVDSVFSKNPLRHWLSHGFAEGRNPSASFDAEYYITKNRLSDEEARCNSLLHYHFIGRYTGCEIYSFGRPHSRTWKELLEERHAGDRNRRIFNNFIDEISRSGIFVNHANYKLGYAPRGIKVSVIMPFYNRADTIGHAARSVLSQTHKNIELILVDDGSTDKHDEVLEAILADPRVKFSRISHSGVSRARNVGLAVATGEYVCFLDSDNVWNPNFLEEMLDRMNRDKVLAAYSGMYRYRDGGFCYFFENFNLKKLSRENFIDINCAIFHKSLLVNEYFDLALYRLNDWDFMIRVFSKHEPAAYNFPGVAYFSMFRGDRISDLPVSQKAYVTNKYEPFIDWAALKAKKRIPAMTSIIMPVADSASQLMECLRGLVAYTDTPHEIILVDNHDNPEVTEEILNFIAGCEEIKYLRCEGDYNWGMACNLGFACSRGEYVCFLSGSILPRQGWLKELLAALDEKDGFAVPLRQEEGKMRGIEAISIFSQIPYEIDISEGMEIVGNSRSCAATGPCVLERAGDFIDTGGFSAAFLKDGAMLAHTLNIYAKKRKNGVVAAKSKVGSQSSGAKYSWWGDWSAYKGFKNFSILPDDVELYASLGLFPYEYQMAAISPECGLPYVKSVKLASRKTLEKADLSILVIKPSGIGNMLFTMPLLVALRKMLPQARITVLCFGEEAPIAAKEAHHVITLNRTEDSVNGWKDEFAAICAKKAYDIVMVPPGGIDKNTPGVAKAGGLTLAHPWIEWDKKSEAEHCLDLARMLGFRGSAKAWLYPVDHNAPRLCIAPYLAAHIGVSNSAHMRKKLWPARNWARLLKILARKRFIYLVEGPNEREINNELLNLLDAQTRKKVIVKATATIDDCANYLQFAEAMISLDGGIGHLANHIGIPVVMLFGPTSEVKGFPRCDFAPAIALTPDATVTCAPCYPVFPDRLLNCERRKCLESVTPERVLDALSAVGIHI